MTQVVEIGPVPTAERTQRALDLFLIFAGANIVATTFQVGASLAGSFGPTASLALIGAGSIGGSALVAALAPIGPRLGVPSVIATRAVLGTRGAGLVAVLLYGMNFVWIALNNAIAASVCASLLGGADVMGLWAVGFGLTSAAVVARGPRAVARADRFAVPAMLLVGVMLTVACVRLANTMEGVTAPPPAGATGWLRGFDVVVGYQVSWILMFADYSRFTRSAPAAAAAVFFGLTLTSLWFMPLGLVAARAASSADPGAMLAATGLGWWAAVLLALATVTTNFVNIYLSSLAWKSVVPRTGDRLSVWSIGVIGAGLSLFSTTWLTRFADFTLVLGGVLVPVGGILLAHFTLLNESTRVADLYDPRGPYGSHRGWSIPGLAGWAAGSLAYLVSAPIGSTLPSLVTAMLVYLTAARVLSKRR